MYCLVSCNFTSALLVNPFFPLVYKGAHGLSCVPAQADSLLTMFDPLSSGEGNVNRLHALL